MELVDLDSSVLFAENTQVFFLWALASDIGKGIRPGSQAQIATGRPLQPEQSGLAYHNEERQWLATLMHPRGWEEGEWEPIDPRSPCHA